MKRKLFWIPILVVALLVIGIALYFYSAEKKHSSDLNVLRAKFNEDRGKVRVLLLLSPT